MYKNIVGPEDRTGDVHAMSIIAGASRKIGKTVGGDCEERWSDSQTPMAQRHFNAEYRNLKRLSLASSG